MTRTFSEIKIFQVKPEKVEQFEKLAGAMANDQRDQQGCIEIKYMKRFYTIDGIELGEAPRELKKIVKCVKYYSFWEFETKEQYGKATKWYFEAYIRELQKMMIMPFEINCGYSV
jgi:hypothetical protein